MTPDRRSFNDTLLHVPQSSTHWTELPSHLRVLLIRPGSNSPGSNSSGPHDSGPDSECWLTAAFASDSATQVSCEAVPSFSRALVQLREERYDAVIVSLSGAPDDAYDFLEAVRTTDEQALPLVVLDVSYHSDIETLCLESGADAYLSIQQTTTRTLLWQLGRIVQHRRLLSENRQLHQAQQHRLQQEHEEAERLLNQQRGMIEGLEQLQFQLASSRPLQPQTLGIVAGPAAEVSAAESSPTAQLAEQLSCRLDHFADRALPRALTDHYRELLRVYVMMGSGNLSSEMNRLAELLATANVTAQRVMSLHVHVLEEMVRGLGSRSARHVMTRADMLILEVMIHLAEGYRQRCESAPEAEGEFADGETGHRSCAAESNGP